MMGLPLEQISSTEECKIREKADDGAGKSYFELKIPTDAEPGHNELSRAK